MMADLFSSMDSNSSVLVWVSPLLVTAISFSSLFFNSNYLSVVKNSLSALWGKEVAFSVKLFLTVLMIFILVNNFLGLLPMVFSTTTSLWVNSSLALIMWGLVLLSGWSFSIKKSAAHLVPSGAPHLLVPFLVLIETISILIRPMTLTVRLVANISAGHIILALISTLLSSSLTLLPLFMVFLLLIFYNLFEMFVSFIQAYIFTLLLSLYISEHPSNFGCSLLKAIKC
uniref:ATP synthase subunit a n=1 Tax=Orcula dolium TaxID=1331962 RepID=A0A1W5ICB0_9EUPU|nr:ATP synthase F0 subunit 6 [Orcula dolium]AIR76271.1 ATP synthase F0 subunit 6 [Orcula dolium]